MLSPVLTVHFSCPLPMSSFRKQLLNYNFLQTSISTVSCDIFGKQTNKTIKNSHNKTLALARVSQAALATPFQTERVNRAGTAMVKL